MLFFVHIIGVITTRIRVPLILTFTFVTVAGLIQAVCNFPTSPASHHILPVEYLDGCEHPQAFFNSR
jgi:hypothetical protein